MVKLAEHAGIDPEIPSDAVQEHIKQNLESDIWLLDDSQDLEKDFIVFSAVRCNTEVSSKPTKCPFRAQLRPHKAKY
jgi:hypothetical protein